MHIRILKLAVDQSEDKNYILYDENLHVHSRRIIRSEIFLTFTQVQAIYDRMQAAYGIMHAAMR